MAYSEVVNCTEIDQFESGKSEFQCGFVACLMAKSMAKNGQRPTLTAAQVTAQSEWWYQQYDGPNVGSNTNGMSLQQEYDLLAALGMHWQGIDMSVSAISLWLRAGYPVIVAVGEASVVDVNVGGNPYPWNASGNHIIILTGLDGDNFLVRDSANCTNLYDPSSLRPGPRHYVANQLTFVSATAIVPPWLARPISNIPPTGDHMALSKGFHDDGHTLTHSNKHFYVKGFRQYALDAMARGEDPAAWVPLEEEHPANPVELHSPSSGAGSTQLTAGFKLIYTPAKGVQRSAAGLEIQSLQQALAAKK